MIHILWALWVLLQGVSCWVWPCSLSSCLFSVLFVIVIISLEEAKAGLYDSRAFVCLSDLFLTHLSRRLTRWAYSISMVRLPSVVVRCRRRPSSTLSNLNISEASLPILIKFYDSITGVGERLHKVYGPMDQNSGFYGNRKPPLTSNGENDVSTFVILLQYVFCDNKRTELKNHYGIRTVICN